MKKHMITLLASLFYCLYGFAQQGDFIYIQYPDEWTNFPDVGSIFFDVNNDNIPDACFAVHDDPHWGLSRSFSTINGMECCSYSQQTTQSNNQFTSLSLPLNSESLIWDEYMVPVVSDYTHLVVFKAALRLTDGENHYYGWLEAFELVHFNTNPPNIDFKVSRTCFCTIPNYPLVWGQTSHYDDTEEKTAAVFATVLPNPGKDELTVKAPVENALIRFYDLQGRLLFVKPFDFNITVNTGDWTQGIYLWEIWNGARKEASGKWIKE